MIISFVGGDRCGKSTQIRRAQTWIRDEFQLPSRVVKRTDLLDKESFPEFAFAACTADELRAQYLPLMMGHARAVFLMYTFAVVFGRYPASKDEVVLVDGYWQKNIGTEGALGIDTEWFINLCSVLPSPDVTVFFDLDPKIAVTRVKKRRPYECGLDFSCSDDSFIRHQARVRDILLNVANKYGWPLIDASKPADEIELEIREILRPFISKMGGINLRSSA